MTIHKLRAKEALTWIIDSFRPQSGLILFVAGLFHPVNRFAVELFLNGDMGHRRGWSGAVPMLLTRRNPDDVTRPNFLDRASPALCSATASRHDQSLPQRVGVPCRPSAGLESHASAKNTPRSSCLEERINPYVAGKICVRPFRGRL